MDFNTKDFDIFKEDVLEALKGVAEKHGVIIGTGNISYDRFDFTMQLKVAQKDIGGVPHELAKFKQQCEWFGFDEEDYGAEFLHNGETYKLVGFNPNAQKFKATAVRLRDGSSYGFRLDHVRTLIKAKN